MLSNETWLSDVVTVQPKKMLNGFEVKRLFRPVKVCQTSQRRRYGPGFVRGGNVMLKQEQENVDHQC